MPDGTTPEPGGWNRFMVEVDDLDGAVADLRAAGVHFRSGIIEGMGGRQLIVEDSSGNPVELFSPTPRGRDATTTGGPDDADHPHQP
jgi:predicted enzyme related to lactoylglutathione lyase